MAKFGGPFGRQILHFMTYFDDSTEKVKNQDISHPLQSPIIIDELIKL